MAEQNVNVCVNINYENRSPKEIAKEAKAKTKELSKVI